MMSTEDTGHPHRCREGHRWQHAGPTALACEIPVHDSETGDLTLVSGQDCPLCSGREDLLIRDLHSHYCNTCSGEWDHEGRCLDGWAASCPWCFPVRDAAPGPGARRGPHFHFCPECAQNWRHDASCAAPLRAALPDCSGCRGPSAEPAAGEPTAKPRATFSPSQPRVSPADVASTVRGLVTSAAVLASVAVALTIPILFQVSSLLWSPAPHRLPPMTRPPTAPLLAPPALPSTAGAQVLHRSGERRRESESRSVRGATQAQPTTVQSQRAAPPNGASTAQVAEATRASSATAQTSNPDALPRGGAALDAMLQGSPLARAPQPRPDLPTWSEESPRWDRASLSVLMNAVVDIRPVNRNGARLEQPAASGRATSELRQQPIRGFIIDEFGHVVTSNTRVGEATSLEVTLSNGRRLGATVVVRNWLNDVAILRLDRRGFALIALGDSGSLVVGDRVLAISNEIGPDRTVTPATVLATGNGTGGNLAVDLAPTPDGVGGPLLNSAGQAVGIVVDGAPSTGGSRRLTFAVPVDRVKPLLRNLSPRPMAELMSTSEAR